MPVPPVVLYRMARGPAYLLSWGRRPDRSWWAQLLWIELTGEGGWRGSRAWVDASDVSRIPGQDYRAVPRENLAEHRENRDLTDPRDPGRLSRAADRARFESRRAAPREPDF
ncbi:hypothetical protein [Actinocorallia longicatena]|uniref:Uncharacterized protein n=1 Tax=Actinocorallia longicatena TaxID=111803 RepID=A0ABP6Q0X3_9ACTN